MNPKLLFFIILCISTISCKKNIKDYYPHSVRCELFTGKYDMYNPVTDEHFDMTISCKPRKKSGFLVDTLVFENFANKYNFEYYIGTNGIYIPSEDTTDEHYIEGSIYGGIADHNGHQTVLTVGIGWYGFDVRKNKLIGDSLFIDYKANNIQFFNNEGVPYEDIDTMIFGRKIH